MDFKKLYKHNLNDFTFELPNIQRIYDQEKIEEIYNYQYFYNKRNGRFNFLGSLVVNTIDNKTFYIIDGQHRYYAFKKLIENNYNPEMFIQTTTIKDMEELEENFMLINKNTPLPEYKCNSDKTIIEEAFLYFYKKYPRNFKGSIKPNRPFINKNMFQEAISFLANHMKIDSSEKLIELIEEHNAMISEWEQSNYPKSKSISSIMLKTCEDTNFYLGLYSGKMVDYCYDWVRDLVKYKKGTILKGSSNDNGDYKKKTIPIVKRKQVWNKYIGNKCQDVCFCCRETEIHLLNFDCGHVKAEINGGTLDLSNLRPICKSCNSSMGTTNMYDFMAIHYSSNISYYETIKMKYF